MIWGEEDTALGKETSFGTERFVSDLTVRYLPRVSHWVQQEAPEAVNEILESWLCGAARLSVYSLAGPLKRGARFSLCEASPSAASGPLSP